MSLDSVKRTITQATRKGSDEGSVVSGREAKAVVAEARRHGVTSAERKAIGDFFQTGRLSAAARATFAEFLGAKPPDVSLGLLAPPAQTLDGKKYQLAPGQSLTFEADGNQVGNIGGLIAPGLTVTVNWVSGPASMGDPVRNRYTLSVPYGTAKGTLFTAHSDPPNQNPDYLLAFAIETL